MEGRDILFHLSALLPLFPVEPQCSSLSVLLHFYPSSLFSPLLLTSPYHALPLHRRCLPIEGVRVALPVSLEPVQSPHPSLPVYCGWGERWRPGAHRVGHWCIWIGRIWRIVGLKRGECTTHHHSPSTSILWEAVVELVERGPVHRSIHGW